MFSRWKAIRQFWGARRVIAVVLFMSFCMSLIPLPTSPAISPIEKDRTQPFPCMNRPCGCRSAQQCWASCCCFTKEQKLAWAHRNGVEVPAAVRERAAPRNESRPKILAGSSSKSATGKPSCCSDSAKKQCARPDVLLSKETQKEHPTVDFVIGVLAQQCQGEGPHWSALPWIALPEPGALLQGELLTSDVPAFLSGPLTDVCFAPPVPPPRTAARPVL